MEARQPRSSDGDAEPEWEVARLFPLRGEWTDEDYFALPENCRVELVRGKLEFLPQATEVHQFVLGYLYRTLAEFVCLRDAGVVVFRGLPIRLGEDHFRLPDLAFMRAANAHRRRGRYWYGADLVFEVVATDDRKRDFQIKSEAYARAGIPEYWIVDPQTREVQVLVLEGAAYRVHGASAGDTRVSSSVLPGFSVSAEAVFSAAEQSF